MNRQEYLYELERALKNARVADSEEIIEEYEAHFELKLRDGYTEEEISARLIPPRDIAAQLEGSSTVRAPEIKALRVIIMTGLGFADFVVIMLGIAFISTVIAVGASALALILSGIFSALQVHASWTSIPYMPFPGSVLIGLSLLSLGLLASIGTLFLWRWFRQFSRAYRRWHKKVMSPQNTPLPPLSIYPQLRPKTGRVLRNLTLYSLACFAVTFVIGYIVLAVSAGNIEFWHVWNWFV